MKKSRLEIPAEGGRFSGYLALPDETPAPGVLVLQEIFGVNRVMRETCDWLASEGFAALCPDLFWRIAPGIDISDQTEEEMKRAFQLYADFDIEKGVEDVAAALKSLRAHESCSGKAGAIGFCLGGLMAYLTAARTDADVSVGYYGVSIETRLGEAARITKPLMLHIAEEDSFVPRAAQGEIVAALGGREGVVLHSYVGREHAFARRGGEHYDEGDAEVAHNRTLAFLRGSLV